MAAKRRQPPADAPDETTPVPPKKPRAGATAAKPPAAAKTPKPKPAKKSAAKKSATNTDDDAPKTIDLGAAVLARKKPAKAEAPAKPEEADEEHDEDAEPDEAATDEAEGDGREAALPVDEDEEPAPAADDDAEVPAGRALAKRSSTSLAPTDLLQRYMAEVSKYPLLDREEETRVARDFVKSQDPRLAERLVKANLRLVVKIAWEYRRAAFNLLDLVQEGNVGLMQGVKKFDPERGVKLSTYAAWWIRAYIIRYLMDNWRLVKLGTTQAQRKIFFNLRKEKEKLARQGITPDAKLLADSMGVTEQEVTDMDRRLAADDSSLDTPIGDDGGATLGDRLVGNAPDIDNDLAEQEVRGLFVHHLDAFEATLQAGGKEQYIFEHRLRSDEPMTLQEVGDHFGISRERARQIEARLVQRLKDYMREHMPDFEHLSLRPPEE